MCLHLPGHVPLGGEPDPAAAWDALDFDRPWLHPAYAPVAASVGAALHTGLPVAQALQAVHPSGGEGMPPVAFVPQNALPAGEAYEAFIRRTRQVPTRDNLHDLFNGLVWWKFPQAKTQLNHIHHEEISASGIGAARGPVRDAATLFDESGAILQAPQPLWQALQARDWHRLFVTLRPLWAQARLTLFGHALMEQLVRPRKNITAHVLIHSFALDSELDLDAELSQCLCSERLASKPFTPLPVLGVPGWWPPNEAPDFYADPRVFRPPRSDAVR